MNRDTTDEKGELESERAHPRNVSKLSEGDRAEVVYESAYGKAGNEQTVTLTVIRDEYWAMDLKDDKGNGFSFDIEDGEALELSKWDTHGNPRHIGDILSVTRVSDGE